MCSYVYSKRAKCFQNAMANHQLPCPPEQMGTHQEEAICVAEHLPRLVALGCTAVVCSHDRLAHLVMEQSAGMGLKIPEDFSIVGFDDSPLCDATSPALTSIRQDRPLLGKSAYYALSSQMNQVHISTLLLHTELIQRDSCAPKR